MEKAEPAKTAKDDRQSGGNQLVDTSLRRFTGYNMKRAYLVIEADLQAVLKRHELRLTTFSALSIIASNPDMTQTQLATALSIERSGVVLIVDELENLELITRNRVPTDRRSHALRVTLAGMRRLEQAASDVARREAALFEGISQETLTELNRALSTIENGAAG